MAEASKLRAATALLGGAGLHRGMTSRVRFLPSLPQSPGYLLVRADLADAPSWPALLAHARGASRRTVIGEGATVVETVEHLLGALWGCGVVGARVEIEGSEPPILDGSAQPWVEILEPHLAPADEEQPPWRVVRSFDHRMGESTCRFEVSEQAVIECSIDFDHPLIGHQARAWSIGDRVAFVEEIAPARTFGFLEDAERLRAAGLAMGADLDSVVVFDDRGLVGGELRFADEPVRHKLLDAIGDLALLGAPLVGAVRLERPSHRSLLAALKVAVAEGVLVRGPR